MIWNIVIWVVVGAIGGWLASVIMKTNQQMGFITNIVVGIIGAFIGGWLLTLVGLGSAQGELNLLSILTSLVGAVVLLGVINLVSSGSLARR